MRVLALLAAIPLVQGLVIEERAAALTDQTQNILKNLTTVGTDVVNLNSTLSQNQPSAPYNFFQLEAILGQSNKIISDVNGTAGTANKSTVATFAESQQVFNTVKYQLAPRIFSLLNTLVLHKPAFDKGGITPTVVTSLQQQREQTRQLGNALLAKTAPAWKPNATAENNQILAKFNQVILYYSQK